MGAPHPDVYLDAIVRESGRAIGMMDREDCSPTLGCMDRTYWAWKFTDFPGPRFQEGLCLLAFLFVSDHPGNPFEGSRRLLRWIENGIDAWARMQNPDGSFDEAYPNERSLAATAFTTFYVAEAVGLLGDALPREAVRRVVAVVEAAGDWLTGNDESHGLISNHLAAAGAALLHAHRLTGDRRLAERGAEMLGRVLHHQSSEGWYEEYGGADPGYQTYCSFYLARALELGGDPAIDGSLRRSTTFLAHFVHPDGSIGGEYGSRGTQTFYPAAFEMRAGVDPAARWMAAACRRALPAGHGVGPHGVDAFNFFPMLNNLVFAHLAWRRRGEDADRPRDPTSAEGVVDFEQAGLTKVRTPRYDAVVGLSKGGVVKAFDRESGRLVAGDCGYAGTLADGRLVSSEYLDRNGRALRRGDTIVIERPLCAFRRPTMNPASLVAFRMVSLALGGIRVTNRWLKQALASVLIHDRTELPVILERRVVLSADCIIITDHLKGPGGERIAALRRSESFTSVHMGSARYFVPNELDAMAPADRDIDPGRLRDGITSIRTIRFD